MSLSIRPQQTSIRPPRPDVVSQENLQKIPCPNLRTLVNEGWLTPDKDGLVDLKQLDGALQKLGVTTVPRFALVTGAKNATKEAVAEQFGGMATGKFNIFRLTGSNLDHAGDTQILRGGFNKDRLDWLLSYAKNGRLGMAELARAQKDARNAEPSNFRDKALGVAELTALLGVYGTKDASGTKSISTAGLTDLYQNARFPTEWKAQLEKAGGVESPTRTSTFGLLKGVVDMAFRQIGTASGRAMMAMDTALGRDSQLNQSSAMGLGLAMCPAGPPVAAPKKNADEGHAAAID